MEALRYSRISNLCWPHGYLHRSQYLFPAGIAVQDGNYQHVNPKTGKQVTVPELIGFTTDYLKVDYIFWCTQEPFYSNELIPLMQASG